jgi:hypothetical protein
MWYKNYLIYGIVYVRKTPYLCIDERNKKHKGLKKGKAMRTRILKSTPFWQANRVCRLSLRMCLPARY